jgi:putative ATP-dependent endonuclease of the OLD family
MDIKHIDIQRFRGIKLLDWVLGGKLLCLVGPGDSTKTTVLDAIELVLAPRWNIPFSDADFYLADKTEPIEITVTVGKVPPDLLREDKFGLWMCGWHETDGLRPDPDNDCEEVLSVRLTIDESLEPQWNVVKPSNDDAKRISWQDRQKLGLIRLGLDVDRQLAWGRGSALTRLTSAPNSAVDNVLATVQREMQSAVQEADLPNLEGAAELAQKHAATFGVKPRDQFCPGLDAASLSIGRGAVALHDGAIPLRASGLGSKRLTAVALQHACVPEGSIILIDEVEHGLEPHRIRRLLRKLKMSIIDSANEGQAAVLSGQVIMTSHSPVAVKELSVPQPRITRSTEGVTVIHSPAENLTTAVARDPESILARKVLICEGKTEVGFCRALDDSWATKHDGEPLAYNGVVPVDGNGRTQAPGVALKFKKLDYEVAYFGDADKPLKPDENTLREAGVVVVIWNDNLCIEERLAHDLPWDALEKMVELAIAKRDERSVLDAVRSAIESECSKLSGGPTSWCDSGIDEETIRDAIGKASTNKRNPWYKTLVLGEELGKLAVNTLPEIPESDLAKKLQQIETWAYA